MPKINQQSLRWTQSFYPTFVTWYCVQFFSKMKRNKSTQGQFLHCMLTWLVFGRIFCGNGIKAGKHSMCGSIVVFLVSLIFIRSFQLFCKWIEVNTRITWICAQKCVFLFSVLDLLGNRRWLFFVPTILCSLRAGQKKLRSVWVV